MFQRSLTFYCVSSDKEAILLKLMEKLSKTKEKSLFLCSSNEEVSFWDTKLWTYSKLEFIPHGSKKSVIDDDAKFCSIWIDSQVSFINNPTCVINDGLDNQDFTKFEKIIDVFEIEQIESAKKRFENYNKLNFNEIKIWYQQNTKWLSLKNLSDIV